MLRLWERATMLLFVVFRFFCVFMDQNVDPDPCTPPVPLVCFIAFCGKTSESRGVRQEEVWAAESTHHVELVTCCS